MEGAKGEEAKSNPETHPPGEGRQINKGKAKPNLRGEKCAMEKPTKGRAKGEKLGKVGKSERNK